MLLLLHCISINYSFSFAVSVSRHALNSNSNKKLATTSHPFHSSLSLFAASSSDDDDNVGNILSSLDLDPMSPEEVADLRAAMTEVINEAVAARLDDIDQIRSDMKQQVQDNEKARQAASASRSQQEQDALLSKIDKLTSAFLDETKDTRTATKLVAAADRNMEQQGLTEGVWGTVGGGTASVAMTSTAAAAAATSTSASRIGSTPDTTTTGNNNIDSSARKHENRIVMVADTSSDDIAKKLLPVLSERLQATLPGLQVDIYKPTATLPVGANNAPCVIMFATSLSDASFIKKSLDLLLRQTMSSVDGSIGCPPTQLVLISTLGTERTNQMPYSLQNTIFTGNKLDKRREMEESFIQFVMSRETTNNNNNGGLDYTVCKVGELKSDSSIASPLEVGAGDVFDGPLEIETAATVLTQAIAYQASARNTTFSVVGSLQGVDDDKQYILDDAFLRLEGPELLRVDLSNCIQDASRAAPALAEYIREWAELLAESGKSMTTPILYQTTRPSAGTVLPRGVKEQLFSGQLLFLPTATGTNYMSKKEERDREAKGMKGESSVPAARLSKDGGIEFLVEVTKDNALRVRAKRCNYARNAVIKELSESTIMSRFKKCLEVWQKDHAAMVK